MKTYDCGQKPFEICGLEVVDSKRGIFWRLPDDESSLVSQSIRQRSKTAGGGRIRFRTNSKKLVVSMQLHTLGHDPCMSVSGASGADVYEGAGFASTYLGLVSPWTRENKTPSATFMLDGTCRQITINLPRNERLAGMSVSIEDDADIYPPLPFAKPGRLCFYGSSITEGGCCSRSGNAYTAVVARWLDTDYVNYGFSGAARGEEAMANIITRKEFSAFIYDYDHNAPNARHLAETHERFFLRIHEAHPDMPVIMMSRPDFDANPDDSRVRRRIIERTYENALAAGSKNVYFIDGETLFGSFGRDMCTVDGCHPNDLGFYRMAENVYGILSKVL